MFYCSTFYLPFILYYMQVDGVFQVIYSYPKYQESLPDKAFMAAI